MNPLSQPHEVERTLKEQVFYPPHDKRKESPQYAKVHNTMVVERDLPCLVCGVRNSTLGDPLDNPFRARDMETHHHIIEWALANAIDLDKFNQRIVARLRLSQPIKYENDFTQQEMLDWVDHDPDNLWVLCDVHHRHSLVGIHSVTYPIWGAQDLIKNAFQLTPLEGGDTNHVK